MESTAGEVAKVTAKWNGRLTPLAELAGSAVSAAELTGLPKADIEPAGKGADKSAVQAAVEAASSAGRPAGPGSQAAGAAGE
jgi:hypothetical protein